MKYLSPAFLFIEYDNRLFARWRHFTHYQNPLKVYPLELNDCVNQVCKSCQMSIVYLPVLKVRNPTNRLKKKLRLTRIKESFFEPSEI